MCLPADSYFQVSNELLRGGNRYPVTFFDDNGDLATGTIKANELSVSLDDSERIRGMIASIEDCKRIMHEQGYYNS